ncbi:MAG: PQQ-binding-like beta-propeller repeat protein [Pseudomonadota bacterium]
MKVDFPLIALAIAASLSAHAQGVAPSALNQAPAGEWPTYHGDSSGAHFSPLDQISTRSIDRLGLAWTVRPNVSPDGALSGGTVTTAPVGAGNGPPTRTAPAQIRAQPLVFDGIVYTAAGSQVQALDARTGRAIWRYQWNSRAGGGLGRGVALYRDSVIFQTGNDNHVVSLDAATGMERWRRQVTDSTLGYAGSTAPVIAGEHLILGMGGDGTNLRAWLESRDPATGELQWKWYVTPAEGEPGIESWPDAKTAKQGGGMPWQQVTYDAQLDLIYVPTGNPVPVFNGDVRRGDNLYTNSVVALHAATGRMAWYFQFTPNDTHDYDATQVPMLFDAVIDGRPRKLMAQFNRNGYYFLLDRITGESLRTVPFADAVNWAKGVSRKGQPITDPAKRPQQGGALLSPNSDGAANYPAASYSPQLSLAYLHAMNSWSLFYLHPEEENPLGWGGGSEYHSGYTTTSLLAVEAATGKVVWKHAYPHTGFIVSAYSGLLSTGGGLLFAGDPDGNFVAYDAASGKSLWHSLIGSVKAAPLTFMLDGGQYILVSSDESLYAFRLNGTVDPR